MAKILRDSEILKKAAIEYPEVAMELFKRENLREKKATDEFYKRQKRVAEAETTTIAYMENYIPEWILEEEKEGLKEYLCD